MFGPAATQQAMEQRQAAEVCRFEPPQPMLAFSPFPTANPIWGIWSRKFESVPFFELCFRLHSASPGGQGSGMEETGRGFLWAQ